MTTVPTAGSYRGLGDVKLIGRQVRYEQLSFWLNPVGAIFTIGFSTVFLVMLGSLDGNAKVSFLDNIRMVQYYVPGFAAYGIMSSCYNLLALNLVNRREMGLLKRLRLSPVPTWILMASIFLSSIIIAALQVVLMMLVGRVAFNVHGPANVLPFVLAVIVGMLCFTALAVGISTLVPNADSAGPAVNIVFFILVAFSGLYFAIPPHSVLATVTGYFPVRHLILSLEAPFNHTPGVTPWPWHDMGVMAIWAVAGIVLALRRWQWAPRRG